ncbi:MAG: hypothetical protein MUO77_19195 [Anaerolineales bacterium]|nr:hypothetical protein [Anaerolineales bacterium]
MNRKFRFAIAALLVVILALTAAGVWAAPVFRGTVPEPPDEGHGGGGGGGVPPPPPAGGGGENAPIDMGTALFTPQCTNGTIDVEAVDNPEELGPAPTRKAFVGDTFKVTMDPSTCLVMICYAYPPEFADKGAGIYKLTTVPPPVWDEAPGAVISTTDPATICVTTSPGTFALIGNP